jgi:hypothetical protein
MVQSPQNAFVSGWPKKIADRLVKTGYACQDK